MRTVTLEYPSVDSSGTHEHVHTHNHTNKRRHCGSAPGQGDPKVDFCGGEVTFAGAVPESQALTLQMRHHAVGIIHGPKYEI